jgi:DNA-binding PadR family transcriptional regulator
MMKRPWYYILLSVAGGHRHGLAIAREVRELSDGQVRLWPATLYGSL